MPQNGDQMDVRQLLAHGGDASSLSEAELGRLKKQYEKLRRELARKRRKLEKLDRAAQAKQHVRQRLQEQSSETGGAADTVSVLQQPDCGRDGDHKKLSVCKGRDDHSPKEDHTAADFQSRKTVSFSLDVVSTGKSLQEESFPTVLTTEDGAAKNTLPVHSKTGTFHSEDNNKQSSNLTDNKAGCGDSAIHKQDVAALQESSETPVMGKTLSCPREDLCQEDRDESLTEESQRELNMLHFGNAIQQSNSPDSSNKKPLFKGLSKQALQGEKLEQVSGICATKRKVSGQILGPRPEINNDVLEHTAELCSSQENLHTEENSQVVASSQGSLEMNTWVDGLMFPAEYYIRTTRGMQRQGRTPEGVARQVRARRQRIQKRKLGTNSQDTLEGACGSKQAQIKEVKNDDTMSLDEEKLSHFHRDKVAKDIDVSLKEVEDLKTWKMEDEKMQNSSPGLPKVSSSEDNLRSDKEALKTSSTEVTKDMGGRKDVSTSASQGTLSTGVLGSTPTGENHLSIGEQVVSTPGENHLSTDEQVYTTPGENHLSIGAQAVLTPGENHLSTVEQVYTTPGENHLSTGAQAVSTAGEGQLSADADSQDSVIPDTQYSPAKSSFPLTDVQKCLTLPRVLLSEDAVQDKLHVLRKGRKALSSHNTPVQGSGLRRLVRRNVTRSCQNSPVQTAGFPGVQGEGDMSPQDWPQDVLSQGSLEREVLYRRSRRLANRCSQDTQTNASQSTPKQNHKVLKEVVKVPKQSEKIQDCHCKKDDEVKETRKIFPVLSDQLREKLKNSEVIEFHLPYSDFGTLKVAKAREVPSTDLSRNCRSRHSNETDPKDVQVPSNKSLVNHKEVQETPPSVPRLTETSSRRNQSLDVQPSLSPKIRNTPKDISKTELGQESVFPSLSPMLHKKCTKEVLDFSLVGSEYVKLKLNKVKSSPRPAAATSSCRSTSGHGKHRQQNCKAKASLPASSTRSENSSKEKDTSVKKDSELADVEKKQQQKTCTMAQKNTSSSTTLSLLWKNKNEGAEVETLQEPQESHGGMTDKDGEESTDTVVPSADHKQPVSFLRTPNVEGSDVDITCVDCSESYSGRNIAETEPVSLSVTPAQGEDEKDSQGTGVEETPVLGGHEEVLRRTGVERTGDVTMRLPEFSACLQLTDEDVVSMALGEATLQEEAVLVLAVCQQTQLTLWVQRDQDWTPGASWDLDKEEEICDVCLLSCEVGVHVLVGGNFPSGHLKIFYTDGVSSSSSLDHTWSGRQAEDGDGCHGGGNTGYHAMAVLPGGIAIATGTCKGGSSVCKLTFSSRDGHVDQQTRLAMPAALRIGSLQQVEGCEGCLLGTGRNQVLLWNHTSGVLLRCVDLPGVLPQPTCLYAAADQGLLFTLLSSPTEQLQVACSLVSINPGTGCSLSLQKYNLPQGSRLGRCVQGSLGGSRLFLLLEGGEVYVWDVFSSEMGSVLPASSRKPSCLTVDKNLLCLGTAQGCVHVYNL